MNKIRKELIISKIRSRLKLISLFLICLVALEIYFFYSFLTKGLFVYYGYSIGNLLSIFYSLLLIVLLAITTVSLSLIIYGFITRKSWAIKFAVMFVIWAMLWLIWGLIIGSQVIENVILIVVYGLMIVFLLSAYVKKYFLKVCIYGGYTLYKKDIKLKNGKNIIIHFFSKKVPKSGTPISLPNGYKVHVNKRKMPYLKKFDLDTYCYGNYKLYHRIVKLRNGTSIPIYFFSKKIPKSGKPTPKPDRYSVKENKYSHKPYLVKDKFSLLKTD